jgi:hypothetical protein
VPEDIVNVALNTAKALISGQYQSEHIEEAKVCEEGQSLELDICRKVGGWFIIEGLVTQPSTWVGSHLKLLFTLLKLPFGKRSCEGDLTPSQLLLEIRHKQAALGALRRFLDSQSGLISPQIHNLVSAYLANALQFLQTDKKRKTTLAEHASVGQVQEFCLKVFQCFLKLPVSSYSQKFVTLLYPICNEIANDKVTTCPPVKSWVSAEDKYLFESPATSALHTLSLGVFHQEVWNLYWDESPFAEWRVPEQSVDSVTTAIQLFCEIFSSTSLNIVNRQQLFKHFHVHMHAAQKLKDSNPIKVPKTVCILLTCVACLKRLAADKGVITDLELINNIRSIFEVVETSSASIVKCLYAEGSVLLCRVMADPQFIPVFIKEIEHRAALEQSGSSVVMLACNMYRHFSSSHIDRNSQMLAHLIQTTSRHPYVGAWAVHALYCIYAKFGAAVEYIVKATLPMAFSHYQNDYITELPFNETMLKLAAMHLAKATDRSDQTYSRALHVWTDLWTSFNSVELGARMVEAKVPFDLEELLEAVYLRLPQKEALSFLNVMVTQGLALKVLERQHILESLFELVGPYSEALLTEVLRGLVLIASVNSCGAVLSQIKSLLSSAHAEESQVGMSALEERQQPSQKAQRVVKAYSLQAKDLAVELLELLIKQTPIQALKQGSTLNACIDSLVSIGFGLCSADRDRSKCLGAQLLRRVYQKFSGEKDPEDPSLGCLAIYEAQVSAAVRQNLESKDPEVEAKTLLLMRRFLIDGTTDLGVWTRILIPVISKFPEGVAIPNPSDFSEITATSLYFLRLVSICDAVQHAPPTISVQELVRPLWPHLRAVIGDLSVVFTQPRQLLKDYKFTLERPVADQSFKHLAHLDWLLCIGAHLAVLKQDIQFLTSTCVAFLFIPFSADREETAFFSQKELDSFFSRRLVILQALASLAPKLRSKQLVDETLQAMQRLSEDPDPRSKSQVIEICLALNITEDRAFEKADCIAQSLHAEHKAPVLRQKCLPSLIRIDARPAVQSYFAELCHSRRAEELLHSLELLWQFGEQEFMLQLTAGVFHCVNQLWTADRTLSLHLDFLGRLQSEQIELCFFSVEYLKETLKAPCTGAYHIVAKFTSGQAVPLLPFLLVEIFALLQFRKEGELTAEELQCQGEVLKLLLLQFRQAPNKAAVMQPTLSLLFSLFLVQSPTVLITAVSKAVQFVMTQAPHEFKAVIQSMPELERKWLEETLTASLTRRA